MTSFILCWFIAQRGGFLHSACAAVGMTKENVSTDSPTVSTAFYVAPRPSSGSPRRASFPQGKLLFRVGRHTASFLRRDNRKVPGTAHRPFPTISLVGNTIQPHRLYSLRCHGDESSPLHWVYHAPMLSFRGSAASRGIFPSCNKNLRKVKFATWEDPSTSFHFGRDDMSIGDTIQPNRLYSGRGGRLIAAPTGVDPFIRTGCIRNAPGTAHRPFPTVSLMGCTVQPHGL